MRNCCCIRMSFVVLIVSCLVHGHCCSQSTVRSARGEDEPKSCCGVLVGQSVSIRWFILLILLVGLCCAVVGTVLGAMKASGREHLTVSLLMIGVGIVLVTVSGVAWRLTSQDAPTCRMMLGGVSGNGTAGTGVAGGTSCGDDAGEHNRRFVPRLPPSYGRPHHPYAAMMYPEFQFRPPPPSYQASMQEYRLRLLLLDRHPGAGTGGGAGLAGCALSPPPTYRSHAGSLLRTGLGCRRDPSLAAAAGAVPIAPGSEYSRPPSYRSRSSSTRPSLEAGIGGAHSRSSSTVEHSRDPSLSLHSDPGSGVGVGGSAGLAAGVSVISVLASPGDTDKLPRHHQEVFDDPTSATLQMMLQKTDGCGDTSATSPGVGVGGGNVSGGTSTKENLVTIVQTGAAGDSSPVIVTVSGSTRPHSHPHAHCGDATEMEILAHL